MAFTWWHVQFFCQADCDRCRQQCDGIVLDGRRVALRRLTKGALSSNAGVLSLSAAKAIDLMNHFVGFNRWSSEVVKLWKPEAPESAAGRSVAFSARVRVLVSGGVVVEGVSDSAATADAGDEGGPAAVGAYATSARHKKAAVTNALKAALAQLAVVRFADGRTVVRAVEVAGGAAANASAAPALVGGQHGVETAAVEAMAAIAPRPLAVD